MLNLKKKILDYFSEHGHEKSPEAEVKLILFNVQLKLMPMHLDSEEACRGSLQL